MGSQAHRGSVIATPPGRWPGAGEAAPFFTGRLRLPHRGRTGHSAPAVSTQERETRDYGTTAT